MNIQYPAERLDISDEDSSSVLEGQEDGEEEMAPHPFPKKELNDLVHDLNFSKSSAELL